MPTDEQYGHQLGAQLRRETEDVHVAPGLAGQLRRRQARHAWTMRTAFAMPVAVAAAAILATTAGPGAPGAQHQADGAVSGTNSGAVQLQNVAYVREQTVEALSKASQYVIYAKSTYGGGYYERWTDKATQRYRNDVYTRSGPSGPVTRDEKGNAVVQVPPAPGEQPLGPIHLDQSHSVSGPEGNQTVVTVDYDLKTWWTNHETGRKPASAVPDITDADSIRKAITDGTLELLGNETVDGIDTLHLRLYGPNRSYRIDMWVDATTYLPVQDTAAKSSGEAGPEEFPASHTVTTKYSWLPRTEESLARLVLTPPAGFTKGN